jgi:thiol-disulfide isomerase/thioredoxin
MSSVPDRKAEHGMKQATWIAAAAALLVLGVIVLYGLRSIEGFRAGTSATVGPGDDSSAGNSARAIRFVKNPQSVPEFTLPDLDGKPLSTADWRGKVVLINFWATWCPPCVVEIPDLVRLQDRFAGELLIVGLSQDAGPVADVKAFAQKMKMNYPIAIVTPEVEAKFGGVFGLPTTFVVDPQGRVVQKHVGLFDPAMYEAEILALLGKPVDVRVEEFEDAGQVMIANAKNATELPGVDLSRLAPDQKRAALRRFNEDSCPCGCGFTLAQCRINDSACEVSRTAANKIVTEMLSGVATPSSNR